MTMQLAEPLYLYLMTLLLVSMGILYYASKKRQSALRRIAHQEVLTALVKQISFPKRRLKNLFILTAMFLIILSLARPQWGRKIFKVEREGIDIIFLIDVSKSMLAEDILPNRLVKAKIQLSSFLDQLKSDRVGLVVFAGEAFVSCPLTLDFNALKIFIDQIDPDMIQNQGTQLGEALEKARGTFTAIEKTHKAIVLLTDGEDHGEESIEIAKKCKKEGIHIYTIGIGKREGEPIPIKDSTGNIVDYLKDSQGKMVISRLDERTLQKIASETGGKYVYSASGELELASIYAHMQSIEKKQLSSKKLKQREDRYGVFISLALFLLLLEILITDRRKPSED